MAQFSPDFNVISNKKKVGLQGKMAQFSQDFHVISKKEKEKKVFTFPQIALSVSFQWAL